MGAKPKAQTVGFRYYFDILGQCWSKSWMVLTVGNYRTKAIKTKGSKK